MAKSTDTVDGILGQWNRERPDLDVSPMGPIGRLRRCAVLIAKRLDATFAEFGLSSWEFDVLATLRRHGAPHCMAPGDLISAMMIASGTMTHRLQRLEASGWVVRLPNPQDARSLFVQLTPEGLALIDRAVTAHVANEHVILSPIKASEVAALDTRLKALLSVLDPT